MNIKTDEDIPFVSLMNVIKEKEHELAEKLMGENYFTNMQAVMMEAAIELSKQKEKNERL